MIKCFDVEEISLGEAGKSERRHLSEEHKQKISKAHMDMKPSEETKLKMKLNHKGMLGKHHSKKAKQKISMNHARPMLGKKLSEEAKQKLVESNSGEKHWNWKGEHVGYSGVHTWVKKNKPKINYCEVCGSVNKRLEISNISGEYKRDINDYNWLCSRCHKYRDGTINNLKRS